MLEIQSENNCLRGFESKISFEKAYSAIENVKNAPKFVRNSNFSHKPPNFQLMLESSIHLNAYEVDVVSYTNHPSFSVQNNRNVGNSH